MMIKIFNALKRKPMLLMAVLVIGGYFGYKHYGNDIQTSKAKFNDLKQKAETIKSIIK